MNLYTWNKLASNATILNPSSRGINYPYVPKWDTELILPYIGTKSVLVKLKAWGKTQQNIHNVTLLFGDCEILEGDHPELSLYEYFRIDYQGKIYYIKKFNRLKNPLTNRCSCFTSDTKIILSDGTTKTFAQLTEESCDTFNILCYDYKTDKQIISQAGNCGIKQYNTDVIQLNLNNGYIIKCTPDHLFMDKYGNWIQAKDLKNVLLKSFGNSIYVNSIEYIGMQDVYCLTVPDYQNFYVYSGENSGIVAHNCQDYFYTWAWYNAKNGSCLYGPLPRPYQRKTKTRPQRNQRGLPGICKHIYHAWDYLKHEGLTIN